MDNVLDRCPVVIETPVAWGQMDAFRHLNNTAYFRFFESARIAYFEKLDLLEFMESTGVGPILASTNCRFKIPLTYPDTVSIGSRVGAQASPSEVLVSQTVKDLVAGSGLTFEDSGEYELKGVPDRWHLYRVLN